MWRNPKWEFLGFRWLPCPLQALNLEFGRTLIFFGGAFLVKVRSMAILIIIERDQMNPELQGTLRVRDLYIHMNSKGGHITKTHATYRCVCVYVYVYIYIYIDSEGAPYI